MKNKYFLDLRDFQTRTEGANFDARTPTASDKQLLAELMLDAYENTIDWQDETLEDAVSEVEEYFEAQPLLAESLLVTDNQGAVSACLVSYLQKQKAPLIAYVMTAKRGKRNGIAQRILQGTIQRLHRTGHERILAGITDGNVPSENLFERFGFQKINS